MKEINESQLCGNTDIQSEGEFSIHEMPVLSGDQAIEAIKIESIKSGYCQQEVTNYFFQLINSLLISSLKF